MSTIRNGVTIWLMSCEDVERMLKAKYGNKLATISKAIGKAELMSEPTEK